MSTVVYEFLQLADLKKDGRPRLVRLSIQEREPRNSNGRAVVCVGTVDILWCWPALVQGVVL